MVCRQRAALSSRSRIAARAIRSAAYAPLKPRLYAPSLLSPPDLGSTIQETGSKLCHNHGVPALWIFGYGSLIFRPGFPHEEKHPAIVSGWTRRLDQGSPDHRGTPERLGRVATLVPMSGGAVGGVAYRVAAEHTEKVLAELDHREKGGYDRITLSAQPIGGGPTLTAITWIASPDNPYHLGPMPLAAMVEQIRDAVGPSGPNVEYVLRLAEALAELGIVDSHVDEVAQALRLLRGPSAPTSG